MSVEGLRFLTDEQVREIAGKFGTPVFVYSRKEIEKRCEEALSFPNEYGLNVHYAMKASSNFNILQIIKKKGIGIDASSEFEVQRAYQAGFQPSQIMLTSQEMAKNLDDFVRNGGCFNACSLHQLEEFGKQFKGSALSIRINPGLGSGWTTKTDVGGTNSSFGIWHELLDEAEAIIKKYDLKITKVHTHIGSGSDPEVWKAVAKYTLEYAEKFTDCTIVNLGGGYKIGRMKDEKSTNLQEIGKPVRELFVDFYNRLGRKLKLEIEPGTYLVANTSCLIASVDDVVHTGEKGYEFIKLNTGMDSNTRPSLYGAQHPIISVPLSPTKNKTIKDYVVVGHCCETGDVFTQEVGGNPITRSLEEVSIGDYIVMEGTGAYCSSMSVKNYNSYPETPEILIDLDGSLHLIRKKQTIDQIVQNEIKLDLT